MVASRRQFELLEKTRHHLRRQTGELVALTQSSRHLAEVLPPFATGLLELCAARSVTIYKDDAKGTPIPVAGSVAAPHSVEQLAMQPNRSQSRLHCKLDHDVGAGATGRQAPLSDSPLQANVVVSIEQHGNSWGVIECELAAEASGDARLATRDMITAMARVLGRRVEREAGHDILSGASDKEVEPRARSRPTPPVASAERRSAQPTSERQDYQQQNYQRRSGVSEALLNIYEGFDRESTAAAIANELRLALDCDRVAVLVERVGSCQVAAISGQESINHRAEAVRSLTALGQAARSASSTSWFQAEADDASHPLREAVKEYQRHTPCRRLAISPLRSGGDTAERPAHAVVIVEYFHNRHSPTSEAKLDFLAPHAARALARAEEIEQIFLWRLGQKVGALRGGIFAASWRKWLSLAALLATLGAVLGLVSIDFRVPATGVIQPVAQRDVFAAVEGVVSVIHVEHGDLVREGDVLIELRNVDLEVRLAETLGHRRAAQEQLCSLQRLRHVEKQTRQESDQRTGQTLQLQVELESLDEQLRLLLLKKERLLVRSPMSGQVTTWNARRALLMRPVQAGQSLLTIADCQGPWRLEVYVPEAESGHLLATGQTQGQPVDYLVTSNPTITRSGRIGLIDDTAQLYEEHGHALRALVEIERHDLAETPSGATVRANIHCGRRSIGYVWLNRLIHFVYARVLFPLF